MKAYEYSHIIGFEETSIAGNVYYSNHVRWQGRCREMFLQEHTPEVIQSFAYGFALITTRVSCEYLAELFAFDEIIIRMRLGALKQNRITMFFDYLRVNKNGEELVARGEQEIACMQRDGDTIVPAPVPAGLREVLRQYRDGKNF